MKKFNIWPWVPVVILVGTVLANILLIKLATEAGDADPRLPEAVEAAQPGG